MDVRIAENDEDIMRCFLTMSELRPHLKEEDFLSQVRRQEVQGFFLAYIEDNKKVVAVSGFHLTENLVNGKYIYVDDLITGEKFRSKGYGEKLLKWIVGFANEENCSVVELDSGVQRFDAHRFYLRNKMKISSHHFSLELK
jgi:GNAT superfamily N-acetyltransferase